MPKRSSAASHRHDDYVDAAWVKQIDKVACNGDRQIGIAVARRVCGEPSPLQVGTLKREIDSADALLNAELAPLCNTIGAGMNRSVEQQARLD